MATKEQREQARLNAFFSGRGEGWLSPSEKQQENRVNAENRIDGAIAAGALPTISEREREDLIQQVLDTGNFDLQRPLESAKPTPAAPVVPVKKSYWDERMDELRAAGEEAGAVVDTAQGSLQDFGSGALAFAADNQELTPGGFLLSDEQKAARQKEALEQSGKLHEAAVANQELAKPFIDKYNKMPGLEGAFGQTVFDLAQSPSSGASLVGGPAAILPLTDVFFREYGQARRAGLTEEQANISATAQAVPEGLLSIVPARKVLSKVPGVRTVLKKTEGAISEAIETRLGQALHTAIKATSSAAGEGLEEGVTGVIQDAASRIQGLVGPEKAREYAQAQTVGELGDAAYWNNMLRQARAGAAMGAPVGAVEGMVSGAKEASQARKERADTLDTSINVNTANALLKGAVIDTQDTILEDQRVAAEKAKQQAFDEAEKRAAEQKELEEEAGFQTLQRGDVAQGSRVERYAGVVERVPTNPAREVRPEDVAEQRDAAQRAEAERVERVRQGKLVEEVRKERERLAKGKQAELKGKNKAEQKLLREQRGAIRRELIESNPDATDLEIGEMLEERMKNTPPPQVFTDPIEKKAASALKSITTTRKRLATSAETKRMNALAKRNPNATPQELAALFNGQPAPTAAPIAATATPVVSKPDASTTEKERDDAINKMGITLRMAADSKAPDAKPNQVTLKEWRPVARKVVDALVNRTDGKSRSVQTLLNQGKLIMAPNAKFLGREDLGSAAEYDPADGKMYLYTDNLDPNDVVSHVIEAASHEGTHGTTRNQREGRAPLMQTLLGKDGASAAVGKIRTAAKNGNKIAQEAVRLAEADTADRNGDDTYENEEILAYFTGQAVANRDKPLGTVAGVIKDMRTGVRSFLRDRVGLDLDVDMSDLNTAAQRVLEETTKTDLQPGEGAVLRMIYNKNSKGYAEAVKNGWVYDSVDGNKKYVLSDADATLVDGAKVRLRDTSKSPKLSEVLNHEVLYREHPEARNIPVHVVDSIEGNPTGFALYDPNEQSVWVTKRAVNESDPTQTQLKEALMHEIQHYVQDVGGYLDKSAYLEDAGATKIKEDFTKLNTDLDKSARAMLDEVPNAVRGLLDKSGKDELTDIVFDREASDSVKAAQISSLLYEQEIVPEAAAAAKALDTYRTARYDRNAAMNDYNRAVETAHEDYLANILEREAFRTQGDTDLTEEEVRDRGNPEEQMREQSAKDFPRTAGRIDVPEADFDTRFKEAAGRSVAGKTLENGAFKTWFGNSVAVNEDGTPRRFYTGTSKDTNFTSFRVPKNGAWFTANPEDASQYALENDSRFLKFDDRPGAKPYSTYEVNTASRVFPVYLRAENPYVVTDADLDALNVDNYKRAQGAFFDKLRREGYDSVIFGKSKDDFNTIAIIDSPTQIKSVLNDNPTNKSKDVLRMAARTPREFSVPISKRIAGLFSPSAFTGPEILEAVEHAKSSPAEQRLLAAGMQSKFTRAMRKLAKERGTRPEVLINKMVKELDALDKASNDMGENLKNFTSVVEKYGDAGKVMLDFRKLVDDLSLEMLKQRAKLAEEGVPLTEKEKKAYTTVAANMGRYSHRQFAVNISSDKNTYAYTLLEDYEKGKTKGLNKLSDTEKANYDKVAKAVAKLGQDILIPDAADISELDGEDIADLYGVWGTAVNPDTLTQEDKINELLDMRDSINSNTDVIKQEAEAIAKQILAFSTESAGRVASRIRGNTLARGILKERTDISPEIRELMGEITDPGQRLFVTAAKLGEFVARNKMLAEISHIDNPEHIQPPGRAGRPEVKGMVELKSEAYGALQGYWVSHNLHGLLADTVEQLATFEHAVAMAASRPDLVTNKLALKVFEKWQRVAGTTKALQIMGKPFNFLMNFAGGPRTLLMNGNINPVHMKDAVLTAIDLIRNSIDPSHSTERSRRVTAAGVTDSAFIGELTHEEHEKLIEVLNEMVGKSPSTIAKIARRSKAFIKEGYSMMDVMYKIGGFYQQAAVLKEYHKANGDKLTQEQIDRKAANNVNKTYVTYKRALPVAKVLERSGGTMFGTYFSETIRTDINAFRQVVEELKMAENAKTPEAKNIMRWQAARRLTGIVTAWGLTIKLAQISAAIAFGDDDDEDRIKKLRAMLPDFIRDSDFIPVGKNGKNSVLFAWSILDPSGPVGEAVRGAVNGELSARKMAHNIFDLYVAPRIGKKLWDAVGISVGAIDGKAATPVSQQLFPELYSDVLAATSHINNPVTQQGIEDRTVKAWTSVAETFMPGVYGALRETNPAPEIDGGVSLMANVLRWGGATLYELDPVKAAKDANFEYKDTVSNSKKRLAELATDRTNLSEEDITIKLASMRQAEIRKFDQLRLVVGGMEALGMSSREITVALTDAGVDKKLVNPLKTGKFSPTTTLSKRSLDNAEKKDLVGKTPEEKQEVKAKWKKIKATFKSASEQSGDEE